MKRLRLIIFMLFGVFRAFASSPLEGLEAAMDALGCYDVRFVLEVNGEVVSEEGRYRVEGDSYTLSLMDHTLFCDGEARYTINHAAREVVIEPSVVGDDTTPILLLDPTKAFKSLESHFDAKEVELPEEPSQEVAKSQQKKPTQPTILQLTPKEQTNALIDMAFIQIDRQTQLPCSMVYITDGEMVRIDILDISHSEEGVVVAYPDDYEIIDIR